MNQAKLISAQVVLTAASGARPDAQAHITSENLSEWAPAAGTVGRVAGVLRAAGFEVGPCVGNSFSITGTARQFESAFHTSLRESKGEGVHFSDGGHELAASKIPDALKSHVASITFTPPPDFGPGNMSSSM